jgi:CPA2 family monovalent cation:H+ antiporter-2
VSRGEFSIIMANLGRNGGLLPILQPFAALYVLILAILGPLLTIQSRFVFEQLNKIFRWQRPPEMKEDPPHMNGTL